MSSFITFWRRTAALTVLFLGLTILLPAPFVSSSTNNDIFEEACKTAPNSTTCKSQSPAGQSPLTGTDGILYRISMLIASVAGIAAIILLIVSGFRYINSGGDSQKTAEAKKTVIGTVIGLVIIVLAQAIITFVVRRIQ